jgi:hypothetical protein
VFSAEGFGVVVFKTLGLLLTLLASTGAADDPGAMLTRRACCVRNGDVPPEAFVGREAIRTKTLQT